MENNIDYINSNEGNHFHKSNKILMTTIGVLASLMSACTERSRPIVEPLEPDEVKEDTTPPNIKILIDTTKTYSYDITIDPTQNTQ